MANKTNEYSGPLVDLPSFSDISHHETIDITKINEQIDDIISIIELTDHTPFNQLSEPQFQELKHRFSEINASTDLYIKILRNQIRFKRAIGKSIYAIPTTFEELDSVETIKKNLLENSPTPEDPITISQITQQAENISRERIKSIRFHHARVEDEIRNSQTSMNNIRHQAQVTKRAVYRSLIG